MEVEAGRELDILIAEKVFGFTVDREFEDTPLGPRVKQLQDKYDEYGALPQYSSNIAEAFDLLEQCFAWPKYLVHLNRIGEFWYCGIEIGGTENGVFRKHHKDVSVAICLAALKAVGEMIEGPEK